MTRVVGFGYTFQQFYCMLGQLNFSTRSHWSCDLDSSFEHNLLLLSIFSTHIYTVFGTILHWYPPHDVCEELLFIIPVRVTLGEWELFQHHVDASKIFCRFIYQSSCTLKKQFSCNRKLEIMILQKECGHKHWYTKFHFLSLIFVTKVTKTLFKPERNEGFCDPTIPSPCAKNLVWNNLNLHKFRQVGNTERRDFPHTAGLSLFCTQTSDWTWPCDRASFPFPGLTPTLWL